MESYDLSHIEGAWPIIEVLKIYFKQEFRCAVMMLKRLTSFNVGNLKFLFDKLCCGNYGNYYFK